MPFPKSPDKKVRGKLTLMIAPPDFTYEVEAKPAWPGAKGMEDGKIKIKPPLGFSVVDDFAAIIEKQFEAAHKNFAVLRERLKTCGHCNRKTSEQRIAEAESFARVLKPLVLTLPEGKLSIISGQKTSGEITLDVIYNQNQVSYVIGQEIEAGLYRQDSLVKELVCKTYNLKDTVLFLME